MIYTDERCENQLKQGGIFIDPITNCIRKLLSGYARIYNNQYRQSGSVFRQKTKSKCLTEIKIDPDARETIHDYYINCFHYIHQNPFTAGLVQRLEDWEFSSFRDYAALRSGDLCRKELAIAHCGYKAETFIDFSYELVQEKMKNHFYEERISGRLNKGPG